MLFHTNFNRVSFVLFSFLFIRFFSSCRFTFTVSCYCLCLSFYLSLHSSTCPFYFSPSCLQSAICSRNARDGSLHGSRRKDFHTVTVSVFGAIFHPFKLRRCQKRGRNDKSSPNNDACQSSSYTSDRNEFVLAICCVNQFSMTVGGLKRKVDLYRDI